MYPSCPQPGTLQTAAVRNGAILANGCSDADVILINTASKDYASSIEALKRYDARRVRYEWLEACIRAGERLSENGYALQVPQPPPAKKRSAAFYVALLLSKAEYR